MRLAQTIELRQQQTQRVDPRQIYASEILSWTPAEVEAAIERETAENPALDKRDDLYAGAEGAAADLLPAAASGSHLTILDGEMNLGGDLTAADGPALRLWQSNAEVSSRSEWLGGDAEPLDTLDRLSTSVSLHDHLRSQVGLVAMGLETRERAILTYLIECVDERGYLSVDENEIAEQFRVCVSTVAQAVGLLQSMEPAGVGARDLRECLILQADQMGETGDRLHPLVRPILVQCWDDLACRREDRIARVLHAPASQVRAALRQLRSALAPYPGLSFRPAGAVRSGESLGLAAIRPDLIFERTSGGFAVSLTRVYEETLAIAPLWRGIATRNDASQGDEAMRRYVREQVERAETFLGGLARRGKTLKRIAAALIDRQPGYLATGSRAFLRPLTRQALAEELQLDESVISRAVADKWVRLPNGDVVQLDAFFGNAHAVRDALMRLVATEDPAQPLSDDSLVELLGSQGFPLARRTVAKYRAQEKILPARLRRRTTRKAPERKAA